MLPKNKDKIEEYRKKLSDKARGNKNSLGVKRSDEWKENLIKRNTGKKHKPESIEKIKKNRKGKAIGDKNASWKGGKPKCIDCGVVVAYNAKRCQDCFYKHNVGEKHGMWNNGSTPINKKIRMSKEYKLWRIAVFERDDYTCVWCGARSGNGRAVILHADHIKPFACYPELRFAIDNGRTLCIDCHKKTDSYGRNYHKTNSEAAPSLSGSE